MRRGVRMATLLVAFLLTALVGVGIASPAYAASCSGASCVHRDPQVTGCSSGAAGLASVRPPGGGPSVTLRWSSSCRANWARFEGGGHQPGYWTYWAETRDGHREYKMFNNAYWTWMVNGSLAARACIQNSFGQVSCTGWY